MAPLSDDFLLFLLLIPPLQMQVRIFYLTNTYDYRPNWTPLSPVTIIIAHFLQCKSYTQKARGRQLLPMLEDPHYYGGIHCYLAN